MSLTSNEATCPVCKGTCRQVVDETGKPVDQVEPYPRWPQYAKQGWMACHNCGGQTMSLTARGKTRVDPETGQGCFHAFVGENAGRCYTVYTCTKCGARYDIDSGD